jgi:hypothetical protein
MPQEIAELKLIKKRLERENQNLQIALCQKMTGAFWVDTLIVGLIMFTAGCLAGYFVI